MNTDELEAATEVARRRVLEIQAKLHRWGRDDPQSMASHGMNHHASA